jgi:hypothetical protein
MTRDHAGQQAKHPAATRRPNHDQLKLSGIGFHTRSGGAAMKVSTATAGLSAYRTPVHSMLLCLLGYRPRDRPMISSMISVVPPKIQSW